MYSPCQFTKEDTDILGSKRNVNVEKLLYSQTVGLLVTHHGDIVKTVKVWESLHVRLVFYQLLSASVKQSNVGISLEVI